MAKYFGINAPFLGGNERVLSRQEDEKLIRNDLLQLLLTAPEERVMRLDFGTPIRRFVFEQMTVSSIQALRTAIIDAINKFEPRVKVTEVVIVSDDDNNLLNISILGTFNLDISLLLSDAAPTVLVEFGLSTRKNNQLT